MFWSKNKAVQAENQRTMTQPTTCGTGRACPRCGYSVEGLALVCPRCREELPRGCSGNCSSCGK